MSGIVEREGRSLARSSLALYDRRMHRPRALSLLVVVFASCSTAPPDDEIVCRDDDDCGEREVCVTIDDEPACVLPCDLSNPCDGDQVCIDHDGTGVCEPIRGDLVVGEPCGNDTECASGACAIEPGGPVCVMDCTAGQSCLSGTRCLQSGPRLLCLSPLDDRVDGEACETPRDCLSSFCVKVPHQETAVCAAGCETTCADGLVCVPIEAGGQVCVTAAEDGAPCESNAICAGGTCITDVDDTQYCVSACVDGDCATEGHACVTTTDGAEVCLPPLDDRAPGEACDGARDCASGHCGGFSTESEDFGDRCAEPCDDEGACDAGFTCWLTDVGPDLCGPIP